MGRDLTAGEWAVLALVAEAPTHGFAIAKALAPDGPVGTVWTLPRPLVYRALETLEKGEYIRDAGNEPSASGPPRRLFKVTRKGAAQLRAWLRRPIDHVRDGRSLLLLKLLFIDRRGSDPAVLAAAQHAAFEARLAVLEGQLAGVDGFDRTALLWRIGTTRAALEFLDEL